MKIVHASVRAGFVSGLAAVLVVLMLAPVAHAEEVGDCTLNLDWPHASSHTPGRATSNAVIKCRNQHAKLRVRATIYWHPTPFGGRIHVRETPWIEVQNARYVNAAASFENCINGDKYSAISDFEVIDDEAVARSHSTPKVTMDRCP